MLPDHTRDSFVPFHTDSIQTTVRTLASTVLIFKLYLQSIYENINPDQVRGQERQKVQFQAI